MSGGAYETVLEASRRLVDYQKARHLLRWDADVMMPDEGAPARSSQRSTLQVARFRELRDEELGDALARLDEDALDPDEAAVVREIRREHRSATSIPRDLYDELSDVSAKAHETWKRAKANDDFEQWAPELGRHFELQERKARHLDPDVPPFEALWENRIGYLAQPYVSLETMEDVFDQLRDELLPLLEEIESADPVVDADPFSGEFDPDAQLALHREALDVLGLDWDRARFDLAPHPFSYGTQFDVRITTRFEEDDLLSGLMSTIHEFGHTAYTHGLPDEEYGTPLGEPRGLGVHESQSHIFENHIGRSRAFWELFVPEVRERFDDLEGLRVETAYAAANSVEASDPSRTSSGELTKHLHVMLRHEIERAVLDEGLAVERIPEVWAEKTETYFGVRPGSDSEGPLQDPHWSLQIPGFATYTLGSVLAAQFWASLRDDLGDVDAMIRAGNFEPIHDWLVQNIYRHGQRYRTDELIRRVTGENLTADYFIEYARRKYSTLYEL